MTLVEFFLMLCVIWLAVIAYIIDEKVVPLLKEIRDETYKLRKGLK